MIYMCIADEDFGARKCFAFLEDMKNRFTTTYYKGTVCKTKNKYKKQFGPVLEKQMNFYSHDPEADKMVKVLMALEDTKSTMQKNLQAVIGRDDKLSDLFHKTEELQTKAEEFKDQANELKWAFFWKNVMMYLLIFLVIGGTAYFVAAKACGGYKLPSCIPQDEDAPAAAEPAKKPEPKPEPALA